MFKLPRQRKSVRIPRHDYGAGSYFVTICTDKRRCVFGNVVDGSVNLNVYGMMVQECWRNLPDHFPDSTFYEWVVMPNHFHGIMTLSGMSTFVSTRRFATSQPHSLSSIIGQLKMHVTRRINAYRTEQGLHLVKVWQRNYYEHIIRDEKELDAIRRYIIDNPRNWETDENNTNVP